MILWLGALGVPIAGLVLLLAQPDLDRGWEHHPAHFWLVIAIAVVNVALGLLAGETARRLGDAPLPRVHGVHRERCDPRPPRAGDPGVLLEGKNTGFVIATPMGCSSRAALQPPRRLTWNGAARPSCGTEG